MSLARGFTYAGVSSTLNTLWNVNDKTNADIISAFYLNLQEGSPKNVALHLAKINYLNNCSDSKSAPYYWAGITKSEIAILSNLKNKAVLFLGY